MEFNYFMAAFPSSSKLIPDIFVNALQDFLLRVESKLKWEFAVNALEGRTLAIEFFDFFCSSIDT